MDLSKVAIIVAIAKAGSISKASEELFISQPGLSRLVQRFEEEVGAQIFERVSTGVRLTPIGRRFVDNAENVVDQAVKLKEIFQDNFINTAMELNIASMSYHFMLHMLSELYNKYNKNPMNIYYIECGVSDELNYIEQGVVEIGIATLWTQDLKKVIKQAMTKGIEYRRLGGAKAYIAVSKKSENYPKDVKHIDLERLSNMPIVSISPSSPGSSSGWAFMRHLFKGRQLEASNREIRTNNTGTMKEILCQTDGFSLVILNDGIYRRYGFFDEIRLLPLEEEIAEFEIGWFQRANTVRSPLANEFVRVLSEYATI